MSALMADFHGRGGQLTQRAHGAALQRRGQRQGANRRQKRGERARGVRNESPGRGASSRASRPLHHRPNTPLPPGTSSSFTSHNIYDGTEAWGAPHPGSPTARPAKPPPSPLSPLRLGGSPRAGVGPVDVPEHVAARDAGVQLGADEEGAGHLAVQGVGLLGRRGQPVPEHHRDQVVDPPRRALGPEVEGLRGLEGLAQDHHRLHVRLLERLRRERWMSGGGNAGWRGKRERGQGKIGISQSSMERSEVV